MTKDWKVNALIHNVLASLLEVDQAQTIEVFVEEVLDVDTLIRTIGLETIRETLGEWFKPDDVFTFDELSEWALENLKEEEYTIDDYLDELPFAD